MNLTTVPRNIAKLEYSAVRLPLTVLESRVFARYLPDESPIRLGLERFLGSLDGAAGRLLGDEAITRRGEALSRRDHPEGDPAGRQGRGSAQPG